MLVSNGDGCPLMTYKFDTFSNNPSHPLFAIITSLEDSFQYKGNLRSYFEQMQNPKRVFSFNEKVKQIQNSKNVNQFIINQGWNVLSKSLISIIESGRDGIIHIHWIFQISMRREKKINPFKFNSMNCIVIKFSLNVNNVIDFL